MNNIRIYFSILTVFTVFSFSCDDDDETENEASGDLVLNTELFSSYSRVGDFELVDCTLSDGTETQCYKVVYQNSPEDWGHWYL